MARSGGLVDEAVDLCLDANFMGVTQNAMG